VLYGAGCQLLDPRIWRLKVLTTFRELGVIPEIADALEAKGIVDAFPIQALAVPIGLGGHDIIGQARTGTGKTLAFGAPLLQSIEQGGKAPRALVVVPTRELAIQVTDDLQIAGAKLGSRVLSVYGGRAYEPQVEALKRGVDVVVGTPGRLLDLVKQKYLDLSKVSVLVLDEADRMLDLGFLPDVERIVEKVPAQRQTMLFSATMPGEIAALSRRYLTRPTNVRAESHTESEATPQVVQHVFQAHQMDKPEMLARLLQARGRGLTMVFCQTKRACDRVAEDLVKRGFAAAAVHGDLGQGQRERALRAFRSGKIDILVATEVAARGLDIDDVTHVVNYECPEDDKTYVHRIGRTGRAGKEGIAVTFVDWKDVQRWKLINTALDLPFAELVETYSTSEHYYAALDIPSDVTGDLPKNKRDRAGLEAEEVEDIGETGRIRSHSREEKRGPGRDSGTPRRGHGDGASDDESHRPRRRSRQRTRAGKPLSDVSGDVQPEVPATVSVETPPRTRTRTRTRTKVQAEAPVEAPAEAPATEAPAKATRTRSRAKVQVDAPVEPTEAVTAEAPAAEAPAKATRTRSRAKVQAEASLAAPAVAAFKPETPQPAADVPVKSPFHAATEVAFMAPTEVVFEAPAEPTFQAPAQTAFTAPPETGVEHDTEHVTEAPRRRRRARGGQNSARESA
jgi:superfamily II DNA/RNA helicase